MRTMEPTEIPPNMFPQSVIGRFVLGLLSIAFIPFSAIFLYAFTFGHRRARLGCLADSRGYAGVLLRLACCLYVRPRVGCCSTGLAPFAGVPLGISIDAAPPPVGLEQRQDSPGNSHIAPTRWCNCRCSDSRRVRFDREAELVIRRLCRLPADMRDRIFALFAGALVNKRCPRPDNAEGTYMCGTNSPIWTGYEAAWYCHACPDWASVCRRAGGRRHYNRVRRFRGPVAAHPGRCEC